jgi:hypothetical protein
MVTDAASIAPDRDVGYSDLMSTIHEIEDAIRQLPEEELVVFRAWFAEFDAAAWDRQFEVDVAEGRIDALADEALRDSREEDMPECRRTGIARPSRAGGHAGGQASHGSLGLRRRGTAAP